MAGNTIPFIQKLFTSRDNNADAASYVGEPDRIWWDPITNAFYYSDGSTPGGILISGGGGGIGGKTQLDGGAADSIYLIQDIVDGGSAASVYTPSQIINGGMA